MASKSKQDSKESNLPEERNIEGRNAVPSASQKPSVGNLNIYIAYAIVIIPLTVLAVSLLGLVFGRRVHETQSNTLLNANNAFINNEVYYIKINASKFLLLASYSSTAISTVVTFFMVLVSYLSSRDILKQLKRNRDSVPNSSQLALLISTLKGGLGPLWSWVKYIFQSKKEKLPSVLKFSGLSLIIALTFSILITLADTWLHVSTQTVQLPILSTNSKISNSFGRGISAFCAGWYADPANEWPSIPQPCWFALNIPPGWSELLKLLNNVSTENQVLQTTHNDTTYALLGDAQVSSSLDFIASTVAMTTQCTPVSNACNLQEGTLAYNCSSQSSGNITAYDYIYYNDSTMTVPTTPSYIFPNPVYILFPVLLSSYNNSSSPYNGDPEVVKSSNGDEGILVLCKATTYDITYSWINGSVANLVNVTLSNDTTSSTLNGWSYEPSLYGQMSNGAIVAGITSNTSQQLANQLAVLYSKNTVAFSVGMFSSRDNLEEQIREVQLVAQVTKAPLYSLVVLNLLVVLIGGIVGLVAIQYSTGDGVKEARERLTLQGIIKNAVEKPLPGRAANKVAELFENIETKD